MTFKHQCLLYVIRYMPDVVKGEFVNVGVVLTDEKTGACDFRMTRDLRRLRCLDPEFDPDLLVYLERDMRGRLSAPGDLARFMHEGTDWPSNLLQVSAPQGIQTNDMQLELAVQEDLYLNTHRRKSEKMEVGAAVGDVVASRDPRRALRDAFGAGDLSRFFKWNIAVSEYVPDDPLIIDCGYPANGVFKMFHGVPLQKNTDAAKALAFTYPMFSEAFAAKTKTRPEMTAIIDDVSGSAPPNVNFAYRAFLASKISALTVSQLPGLVERARQELGV